MLPGGKINELGLSWPHPFHNYTTWSPVSFSSTKLYTRLLLGWESCGTYPLLRQLHRESPSCPTGMKRLHYPQVIGPGLDT